MKRTIFALLVGLAAPLTAVAEIVPEPVLVEYPLPGGGSGFYLEQKPQAVPPGAGIMIYMHGAGRDETQGMTLFPMLRECLARKGWIYVSPRTYEFTHLVRHLQTRYAKRKIYLAGASRGGYEIFEEVRRHPDTYAGMVQIGSALYAVRTPEPGEINIPTYFVFGDSDPGHSDAHRRIIAALKRQNAPIKYREIENDGHEAPYGDQSWWAEALKFAAGLDVEDEKGTEEVSLSGRFLPVPAKTVGWSAKLRDHARIAQTDKMRMCFLGDSLTEFWTSTGNPVWARHFAPLPARAFGCAGDRIGNLLYRLEHGELDGAGADIYLVMIGTVDLAKDLELDGKDIAEGIAAVVQTIRSRHARSEIVIQSVLPSGDHPKSGLRTRIREANISLRTMCEADGLLFVDLHDRFLKSDGRLVDALFLDGTHLTLQGYKIWAAVLTEALADPFE